MAGCGQATSAAGGGVAAASGGSEVRWGWRLVRRRPRSGGWELGRDRGCGHAPAACGSRFFHRVKWGGGVTRRGDAGHASAVRLSRSASSGGVQAAALVLNRLNPWSVNGSFNWIANG
uniref:Uncharacterized protein n=1 Tax=Oryza brachyantha TaxID=4533 RepID=J3MD22_ORYBR